VPGWKGGKVLPLGGSLGEYSLKDLEEQPGRQEEKNRKEHKRCVIFLNYFMLKMLDYVFSDNDI